ncbi:MAG: toxin-antitoxin system protein [Lachnospiraceae bacterium]|jgi:hypothetical protein|nr:toxin-antitoxin system protein [Lachnospiraceae bacterium]
MAQLKMKVSITLDSDIIEKIKLFAKDDDRSFSQYINLILKEHIKAHTCDLEIENK